MIPKVVYRHQCLNLQCRNVFDRDTQVATCPQCGGIMLNVERVVADAKPSFKYFKNADHRRPF